MNERNHIGEGHMPFLDFTIFAFFQGDQYMRSLINKLWDQGIYRIGQLVELSEADVLEIAPRTGDRVITRLRHRLGQVDLDLGMRAEGWVSPDRPCKKAARARAARQANAA